MDTQNKDLLNYFKKHTSITQRKASRALGIDRLSARVFELRNSGHRIITNTITVRNRKGRKSRVAEYIYLGDEIA